VKNRHTPKYDENQVKTWARYIIYLVIAITLPLLYQWKNITFSYEFEDFLPQHDDNAQIFQDFKSRFASDNDFLLLAVENKSGIFDSTFLRKIEQLEAKIAKMEDVTDVRSILSMTEFRFMPGGAVLEIPYIHLDSLRLDKDSARIYSHEELVNQFVSENGRSLCLFIKHTDFLSKQGSDVLSDNLYATLDQGHFDDYHLIGRVVGQKYYVEKMQSEMMLFISISIILVVIFLWIAFRSVWGILLPQVVLYLAAIWVIGSMGLFREPINILLVLLPSILFVVGMSDVIHLVSKYIDNLRDGMPKTDAVMNAVKEIGLATLLTSVTTAIGFISLLVIPVKPIQSFAIFVSLAVVITFIITIMTLPALFIFSKPPVVVEKYKNPIWHRFLAKGFKWTLRNRKTIPIGFVLVLGVSLYGVTKLEANNFIMDELKDDNPIKMSFNYMDENYGGIRPFELMIELKNPNENNFWEKEVLRDFERVQEYLENEYGVQRLTSLVNILKTANRSFKSGLHSNYKLPDNKADIARYKKQLERLEGGQILRLVLDSTQQFARVTGTIPDWGNKKVSAKNEAFELFLAQKINSPYFDVKLTGTAHLLDLNLKTLSYNMMQGLILASVIIAVLMALLYRSFTMTIISLIPNMLPLVVVAGLMGYMGINLKISTAITFTIAFGIAVDDTIHFLSKLKLELSKGKTLLRALRTTYITTGKAIILTSLVLLAGFFMLILSDFEGTFAMGALVSLSLFVAVIADLLLLPLLLLAFYKPRKTKNNLPIE
jgi:predicted RND superfamily exporter protein